MNRALLIHLLALRYRLLWAQARTGNGKLVLLLVGWIFGMLIVAFAVLGGIGAGQAAIAMGQADRMAQTVLGAVFVSAIFAAPVLGIGCDPAFADTALRRYPLTSAGRHVARFGTAVLGPLWLLVLALYLGLGVGLSLHGVGRVWIALPAALLLLLANYLAVSLVMEWLSRIVQTQIGPLVLLAIGIPLVLVAPTLISHSTPGTEKALALLAAAFEFTPPGVAAAAMAGHQMTASLTGFAGLLAWTAGLAFALVASERLPPVTRAVAGAGARWDDAYDRISSLFGPQLGPLVGKTTRYYARSRHLRLNYPIFIPLMAYLLLFGTRSVGDDPVALFVVALGVFSCLGMVTAGMSLNVFGSDGPGFRRYFLLPVAPWKVLVAVSLVAILPGLSLAPIALLLWVLYGPVQTDLTMILMLASSALGGTLFYQALNLWSSLLGPRPVPLKVTFGNRLSLVGNAVMMVGIVWLVSWMNMGGYFAVRFGPMLMQHWWLVPVFAAAALVFFLATVVAGSAVLVRRRERMLYQIDRRSPLKRA